MAVHVAHPKCPTCSKALFKSFERGGRVRTSDPYRFCRNADCAASGPGGVTEAPSKPVPKAAEPAKEVAPSAKPPMKPKRRALPATDAPAKPADPAEPEAIRTARKQLRELIKATASGKEKAAVGLILAICTQETGNHAAANVLIEQYGLDKKFGILKVTQ